MKQFLAFTNKEFIEARRSGRLLLLILLFLIFAISNPAMAKATPWLMSFVEESLTDSGLIIGEIKIDALTSWAQFYKNVSLILILFAVISGSVLTKEYHQGTLVNVLTWGLARWKIILAKTVVTWVLWTLCYWGAYGVTLGYNAYFWDNSLASHLTLAAFCPYILGIFIISLIILTSTIFSASVMALASTGVVFIASYLLGIIPNLAPYLPTYLLSSQVLLTTGRPEDFFPALTVTAVASVLTIALAVVLFRRRVL